MPTTSILQRVHSFLCAIQRQQHSAVAGEHALATRALQGINLDSIVMVSHSVGAVVAAEMISGKLCPARVSSNHSNAHMPYL